jgi:fimbrial chaperone protein
MKTKIILLVLCLFSFKAFAFKFSPMSQTINFRPNENTTLFYLENDSELPIAIQVSIATRSMDPNGLEKNTDQNIKNDFSFYPSQMIIPSNEKRSVKVTYLGKEIPIKETAYRLIAEQLPVDLEKNTKNKKSIKVLLRYVAALYVTTEKMQSDVNFKSLAVDEKKVSLTIENKGSKHQVLSNLNLKFLDDKSKKETLLTAEELKGMTGENVLAMSERVFIFERQDKFKNINASDKVKISFDKD